MPTTKTRLSFFGQNLILTFTNVIDLRISTRFNFGYRGLTHCVRSALVWRGQT
jgi:hypothetical protein